MKMYLRVRIKKVIYFLVFRYNSIAFTLSKIYRKLRL